MKTDSLFYRIFQFAPSILFELIGESGEAARDYTFRSVELKQTAFRIDGVLLPTGDDLPVYFCEIQMQKDQQLYHRFFAELFLYLDQNPETYDWQGILIYPSRSTEPDQARLHQVLLDSLKVRRIYLDELESVAELPLSVGVVKLIVEPEETAIEQARRLIDRAQQEAIAEASSQAIIDLVETIIVYKFATLNREEIQAMLGLEDLKQSLVYQEALQEGRQEERRETVENLLKGRFGELDESLLSVVEALIKLPSAEFTPLLLRSSREELLDRFGQKS